MTVQDGPDARRGKYDTNHCQLTLDSPVAPGGVLTGQSEDDRNRAGGDARSTCAVGIGPFPSDEVPPAEQGLGLNEKPATKSAVEQSAQPGEQGAIGGRRAGRTT